MSSQELATRDGQQAVARQTAPQSVLAVFDNAAFRNQVAAALPRHIGVDSMMRIALTEVRMNPDLQKCTVPSFMGALLKAAQSGLRPGMFGEGWIIPRWNGRLGSMEAQFQPGYMGLAQLAYRSGEVAEVHAVAVYAADHFRYQLGSDPKIEHEPDMEAEHANEDIVAFYAVVKLTNGGKLLKVMRRSEVDEVRDRFAPRTRAGKLVGPWTTDYEPMGCKTVLIQALKLAPKDSERLAAALQAESDAIFGDRVAAGVIEARPGVAERVASRLGAQPAAEPEQVLEAEATEEAPPADDYEPAFDLPEEEPPGRGPADVTPIRPAAATKQQLAQINRLRKSTGIYEAEFASILDSYGATQATDLTEETAVYVIEALNERGAR
jgi:recombination protein RecT